MSRPAPGSPSASAGRAMTGVLMTGQPAHGRLDLATDAAGELRTGGIDVGRAGTILVVGARIDAEALTRARAMGVRGIVVASLAGKDLRDLLASERRQRAALHGAPPFGILVLEGAMRRALPSPVVSLFEALAGSDVGSSGICRRSCGTCPISSCRRCRRISCASKHGPHTGREGRLEGLAGLRRFEAGTQLESGWVRFDETAPGRAAAGRSRTIRLESLTAPDGVARYPREVSTSDAVVVRSDYPAITRALAARLARVAEPGDLLCLIGELGAGKTQFAKGFGAGLGVTDVVNSPTFVLMTEYDGRLPLFHLDLYRLADAADALAGGLLDERQARASRSSSGPSGWVRRSRPRRLEVAIDGTGDEPRRSGSRPAMRAIGATCRGGRARRPHERRHATGWSSSRDSRSTRHRPAVVAVGARRRRAARRRAIVVAGYRHGESCSPSSRRCSARRRIAHVKRCGGIVVGTGPGRSRGCGSGSRRPRAWRMRCTIPLVGVLTADALLAAAGRAGDGRRRCSCRPGRRDRVLCRRGEPARICRGGHEPELRAGERLIAVDLAGPGARRRAGAGAEAVRGLAAALLPARCRAARRPASWRRPRPLVPEYVTLPRGVRVAATDAGVAVSAERDAPVGRRGSDGRPSARAPPIGRCASTDLADVQAIERASFTDARGRHTPTAHEIETNRLAHYLVAAVDGDVVGYGGIWLMVDEAHVTTFAVHPLWRRRQHRRAAAARAARRRGRPTRPRGDARGAAVQPRRRGGCTRSSASARSGIRPRYYSDNNEDALIMTTEPLDAPADARADRPPAGRARRRAAAGRRPTRLRRRTRPDDPAAPRPGARERTAHPGRRVVVRRDRHRARRRRPPDPRQRRREPGRAARARPAASSPRSRRGPTCAGSCRCSTRRSTDAGATLRRTSTRVAVTYGPGPRRARCSSASTSRRRSPGSTTSRCRGEPPRGPRLRGVAARSGRGARGRRRSRSSRSSCRAGTRSSSRCATTSPTGSSATTVDDAAGEAFDKVGRLLGLRLSGRPGDPARGRRRATAHDRVFPRAWLRRHLRLQLLGPEDRRAARSSTRRAPTSACRRRPPSRLPDARRRRARLGLPGFRRRRAGHEDAAGRRGDRGPGDRARRRRGRERRPARAARGEARGAAACRSSSRGRALCTDNGAMIGAAGAWRFEAGDRAVLDLDAKPSLPLRAGEAAMTREPRRGVRAHATAARRRGRPADAPRGRAAARHRAVAELPGRRRRARGHPRRGRPGARPSACSRSGPGSGS